MHTSEVKSKAAFPLPAVDEATLRYQAAVRDLYNRARRKIETQPNLARAIQQPGESLHAQGDLKAARSDYQQALKLNEGSDSGRQDNFTSNCRAIQPRKAKRSGPSYLCPA